MTMHANVGYVGLDHHHRDPYLQSLEQLPATVTCACEPDPSFGADDVDLLGDVPVYRSVEGLLDAEDVDAVWVTLPNRDTPAAVVEAVERGVDVYTEKPVARTAEELEPLVETVESSDATVAVSYTWRGHPIARELRDRAEAGFFGDVRAFETRFVASQPRYRDTSHYLFDADASRGGILQWLGVHLTDVVPWIIDDEVVRVNAQMSSHSDDIEVEDGVVVQMETASGAMGTQHAGYYLREDRYDTHVGVFGTGGRAEWDPIGRYFGFDGETTLELERSDGGWEGTPTREITYEYDPAPGYGGKWGLGFIRQFFEARERDDVDVPADLRDALQTLRVLDAAYESADAGEWIDVG